MGGTVAAHIAPYGFPVAWIVPTYKNSRPLWRFLEQRIRGAEFNKTEHLITFPEYGGNRGLIAIHSADNPDAIRGEPYKLIVVDEGARVSEETRMDVLEACVADYNGDIIDITTPKGRNWWWREWANAMADKSGYSAAFTAPTSANPMPNIQKAFALAKERLPDRSFRQEWLAEFVEDGGVFSNVDACADAPANAVPGQHKGHKIGLGLDWGQVNDYTVGIVYCGTCEQHLMTMRSNQFEYVMQRKRVREIRDRWQPGRIIAESNSMGQPIIEDLRREGVSVQGFQTTAQSKPDLIDDLILAFETKKIHILNDETLKNELKAFDVTTSQAGYRKYAAREGMHDDCVMALALARLAAKQAGSMTVRDLNEVDEDD